MQKYKLIVSYDGTNYGGWQVQPNSLGIQDVLQKTFKTVLRSDIPITGSGRTDAGVHAQNQTCHFCFDDLLNESKVTHAINSMLPRDIHIKSIEKAHPDFHARYSAIGKTYTYQLSYGGNFDPFKRYYSWHVPFHKFSIALLKEGAAKLIGTHDFKGFANESHQGVASYDSIRTLTRVDVSENEGTVLLVFEGDGFLYKMVRNCVGTLVDIARGHFSPLIIDEILSKKDRKLAGMAAPAHGLCLAHVAYGPSEGISVKEG